MMSKAPHFSVITVTLDNLSGLYKTYESLNSQSCKDFEWIVVDGGSRDGTKAFLEGLKDKPVLWISEPDHGIYDAMNKGLSAAAGQYVLFLNAGDVLAGHDTLLTVSKYRGDVIYGDSYEAGHIKYANNPYSYKAALFTHHQSIYYKRAGIGALRYNLNYDIAADYLFTRLFLEGGSAPRQATYIPFPLCHYEPGGLSQKQTAKGRMQLYDIRRNYSFCNGLENIAFVLKQAIAAQLKRYAPGFYWRLKSRKRPRTFDA